MTILAFVSGLVCLRFSKPRSVLTGADKAALFHLRYRLHIGY